MVKLYASLLSLTLTTSLALAVPHPGPSYYTNGVDYYDRDLLERDLDEEFSGRAYLLDSSDDLSAREPSFFSSIKNAVKDVGKVASKGLHVAENIAGNPIVQAAASFIPGEAEVVAAGKIVGAIGKFEKFEGALKKGKKISEVIKKAKHADRKVLGKLKHLKLGGARGKLGKVEKFGKAIKRAEKVHKIASTHNSAQHTTQHRHHRREFEDDEELSRRDLDDEELFRREYDDFLAQRDFSDDLD